MEEYGGGENPTNPKINFYEMTTPSLKVSFPVILDQFDKIISTDNLQLSYLTEKKLWDNVLFKCFNQFHFSII
jgi:hypothetical protein